MALDPAQGLEQAEDFVALHHRDAGAAVLAQLDEAAGGEKLERLA
jgi:hypothetical protein